MIAYASYDYFKKPICISYAIYTIFQTWLHFANDIGQITTFSPKVLFLPCDIMWPKHHKDFRTSCSIQSSSLSWGNNGKLFY